MSTIRSKSVSESFGSKLLRELTADRSKPDKVRMSSRDLASMLNMLCTLIDNGMPLQKVLGALSSDPSLKKHRKLLKRLHGRLVEGSSLHGALSLFPNAFPANVVQQIKLGESSGNLSSTLRRIIEQLESWLALRNSLLQKLSYPAMVTLAGSGLMLFMLTTVVPQFEKIYAESQVSLPWVTSVVTGLSRTLGRHFYLPLLPILAAVGVWLSVRSSVKARLTFHRILTSLPLIGAFSRDIAILQFLRSVHALCAAGFVPIDAISQACSTVGNRYVRQQLEQLSAALVHGTKLSVAMNQLEHLIPSSVRQLIMVGEHSGNITKACDGCCQFMQNQLMRRTSGALGMIEPILTVSLATCIGWIVLAMYMPMFKMFDVLDY
ncbi:MAG: type II secretion system F family protein [Pirellulaceae bacterium]|jgi:type II secretory pathway component PulF|nr:type II secretion system F family protein [Pirellulaceae bacterium]